MTVCHVQIKTEEAGFFKFEAVKLAPDGSEISRRTLADWFPNIITDQGLDRMGDNNDWMSACQVGTGNTTPTALDTGLVARIAGTTTSVQLSLLQLVMERRHPLLITDGHRKLTDLVLGQQQVILQRLESAGVLRVLPCIAVHWF